MCRGFEFLFILVLERLHNTRAVFRVGSALQFGTRLAGAEKKERRESTVIVMFVVCTVCTVYEVPFNEKRIRDSSLEGNSPPPPPTKTSSPKYQAVSPSTRERNSRLPSKFVDTAFFALTAPRHGMFALSNV